MTPASVLSLSNNFYRGFELCYGNGQPAENGEKNAIIPGIVCLAFSIELGLKAILVGCEKPANGHELLDLFERLPTEDKTEIERLTVGNSDCFIEQISLVSNAFVKWRYLYEHPGWSNISVEFLMQLHTAVDQVAQRYVDVQRAKLIADSLAKTD